MKEYRVLFKKYFLKPFTSRLTDYSEPKIEVLSIEGIEGAERFSKGHGRHGDFEDI